MTIKNSNLLKLIIFTNIAVYVISLLLSGKQISFSMNPLFAFSPSANSLKFLGASGLGAKPDVMFGIWWTFISCNWLHGSLMHIIFNMIALRQLAPLIIHEFGFFRMFSIYTLAGIAGNLLSYQAGVYLTVGASAGLCGLIGASLYYGKSRGDEFGTMVYKQTTGWVLSLILVGFFLQDFINNWSHGGGFIAGIFFAWLFRYNNQRKENLFDKCFSIILIITTIFFLCWSIISAFILINF